MAKSENKTKPTKVTVEDFLSSVDNEQKVKDSYELISIMRKVSKQEPVLWGPSIIGFGSYHYKYASGREGDAPALGFSPRKPAITIYIIIGLNKKYDALFAKLGKHTKSKACLYVKKLEDIDINILTTLIEESYTYITTKKW